MIEIISAVATALVVILLAPVLSRHFTAIPDYWPLYCLVIDFLWGVYFFILFKRQEKQNVQSSSGYL
jgi:hypothetical protein